ncbi:MAG TPA: DNA recombination protein RmuC [Planctomycetes bacterium]|nr:DNA recombination protein RmuC [Planctomycetota bacterium]
MTAYAAAAVAAALAVLLILLLWSIWRRLDAASSKLSSLDGGFTARIEAMNAALAALNQHLFENIKTGRETGMKQAELLGKSLADNRTELNQRLEETHKLLSSLSEKLGGIDQANRNLADSLLRIDELRRLLAQPGARGQLGEAILIETALDVLPQKYVLTQHTFADRSRVDLAIRIGERIIPIDSKFPLDGYRSMLDANTEDDRNRARKLFLRQVRGHVDNVAKYIRINEGTYPFALMYIPSEGVFLEMSSDDETAKHARMRRVIPVGPGSFLAYLEIILEGLKGLEVEKRTLEILGRLRETEKLVAAAGDNFNRLASHLANAYKATADVEKCIRHLSDTISALHHAENIAEEKDGAG